MTGASMSARWELLHPADEGGIVGPPIVKALALLGLGYAALRVTAGGLQAHVEARNRRGGTCCKARSVAKN